MLARNDIGSRDGRREFVRTAIERWDGTGTRASALSNGSVAEAVYEATIERWPDAVETVPERKRLAIGLAVILGGITVVTALTTLLDCAASGPYW